MIFLSISGISSCFQAKTSWFALKKEIIFSFSEARSAVPIFNSFVKSVGMIPTSCGVFDSLGMGFGSLITYVWFFLDARAA